MPVFSDTEEMLIGAIANANSGETLGMVVKHILFPSREGAFACPGMVKGDYVYSLMAAPDGGFAANRLRERCATFISLMQWLVDNRMVLLNPHSSRSDSLFYEDSSHMHISPRPDGDNARSGASTRYIEDLAPGIFFRFREGIQAGYTSYVQCIGITHDDRSRLDPCDTSHSMLSRLADFLFCAVYPTLALRELINDDFKTPAEKVAENSAKSAALQVEKAQWTLIVAIATLFFGVAYPLMSDQKPQVSFFLLAIMIFCAAVLGAIVGKNLNEK